VPQQALPHDADFVPVHTKVNRHDSSVTQCHTTYAESLLMIAKNVCCQQTNWHDWEQYTFCCCWWKV